MLGPVKSGASMVRRILFFWLLLLCLGLGGCSGGGSPAAAGVSAAGPGSFEGGSPARLEMIIRLPSPPSRAEVLSRGSRPVAVRVHVVDPATGLPVIALAEAPFPSTGDRVTVTLFQIPVGRWNVFAQGMDETGEAALQSDIASIDVRPASAQTAVLTFSAAPRELRFPSPPVSSVEDQPLPAVVVEVLDADGQRTEADLPIRLTIGANPGTSTLSGPTVVQSVGGVATFAGLSLDHPGTGYTLAASAPGLAPVESAPFDIAPSGGPLPPSQLAFSGQPSDVQVGATITPAVTVVVKGENGVVVPTATNPVTLVLMDNEEGATLGGTTTVNAVNGVATFSDLSVSLAGDYFLMASSGSLTAANSDPFDVLPPPAPRRLFVPISLSHTLQVFLASNLAEVAGSPVPTGGSTPVGVAIDTVNNRVYVANVDSDNLSVFDATTLTPIPGSPFPAGDGPGGVAADPGNRVYVPSNSGLTVFDAATMAAIPGSPFPAGASAHEAEFDPVNGRIYVTNFVSPAGSLTVLDSTTLAPIGPPVPTLGSRPDEVVYDSVRNRIYINNFFSDNVAVLDASSRAHIPGSPFGSDDGPTGISVDPDRDRVYVTNALSDTLIVYDAASMARIATLTVGNTPGSVVYDSVNNHIIVGNQFGNDLTVLDADSLNPIAGSPFPTGPGPANFDIGF
ncbi:MAG: YncE family protein [Armatimonadetes bacterium]|nr:YncE family protein [Armatimonadota bacterium]